MKNIVVVGGGHSGFSCLWMLLNGHAGHDQHNSLKRDVGHIPYAHYKSIPNCDECCTCPKRKGNEPNPSACQCQCKCCGFFEFKEWPKMEIPAWSDGQIKILYRDKIKVFYSQVKHAEYDGYTDFKAYNYSKKGGFLYSFTGLRGDAKRLYKSCAKGEEKRV